LNVLIGVADDLDLDVDAVTTILLAWAGMEATLLAQPVELLPANELARILYERGVF